MPIPVPSFLLAATAAFGACVACDLPTLAPFTTPALPAGVTVFHVARRVAGKRRTTAGEQGVDRVADNPLLYEVLSRDG